MKCKAVVAVTLLVDVEEISSGWSMSTVAEEAKTKALRRVREVCKDLGSISAVKVTAVMTEEEG